MGCAPSNPRPSHLDAVARREIRRRDAISDAETREIVEARRPVSEFLKHTAGRTHRWSALHASWFALRHYVDAGVSSGYFDPTLLMQRFMYNPSAVSYLLRLGADPNVYTEIYEPEVALLLLRAGASLSDGNRSTTLWRRRRMLHESRYQLLGTTFVLCWRDALAADLQLHNDWDLESRFPFPSNNDKIIFDDVRVDVVRSIAKLPAEILRIVREYLSASPLPLRS